MFRGLLFVFFVLCFANTKCLTISVPNDTESEAISAKRKIVVTGSHNEIRVVNGQGAQDRLETRLKDLEKNIGNLHSLATKLHVLKTVDKRLGKSIKDLEIQNANFSSYEGRIKTLEQQVSWLMTLHNSFGVLFPRIGTSDYIILRGVISRPLVAATVCFWMNSADTKNKGTPISYSTSKHDNELLIYNYKKFQLWVQNANRQTTISANDGKWHHICFTWESSAGSWALYKDGLVKASGKGFKTGAKIQGSGIVVIGQEQDVYGGKFEATQSFVGKMATVNIWSKVMSSREISRMARSCALGKGDVMRWSDVKGHYHGNTNEVSSLSCA